MRRRAERVGGCTGAAAAYMLDAVAGVEGRSQDRRSRGKPDAGYAARRARFYEKKTTCAACPQIAGNNLPHVLPTQAPTRTLACLAS